MQRYFLKIAYNGSAFHGWQKQHNAHSVQAEIEDKMSVLFQAPVEITGCGRTDTGVHARCFFLHFDAETLPFDKETFIFKLNCMLPSAIAVYNLYKVKNTAHARFDAVSRTYQYRFITEKNPFEGLWAWQVRKETDFPLMEQAAQILLKYRDFGAFCKSNGGNATNICEIKHVQFIYQKPLVIFEITANRFLRNMVRAITGTLADVGLGKTTLEEFEQIIQSGKRSKAGFSAPAHALFLTDVKYPDSIFLHE